MEPRTELHWNVQARMDVGCRPVLEVRSGKTWVLRLQDSLIINHISWQEDRHQGPRCVADVDQVKNAFQA